MKSLNKVVESIFVCWGEYPYNLVLDVDKDKIKYKKSIFKNVSDDVVSTDSDELWYKIDSSQYDMICSYIDDTTMKNMNVLDDSDDNYNSFLYVTYTNGEALRYIETDTSSNIYGHICDYIQNICNIKDKICYFRYEKDSKAMISFLSGEIQGKSYVVEDGKTVGIGRGDQEDIKLPASYIMTSRHHCSVRYDGEAGTLMVKDESSNGIYDNNGDKIEDMIQLAPGSIIDLGDDTCRVVFSTTLVPIIDITDSIEDVECESWEMAGRIGKFDPETEIADIGMDYITLKEEVQKMSYDSTNREECRKKWSGVYHAALKMSHDMWKYNYDSEAKEKFEDYFDGIKYYYSVFLLGLADKDAEDKAVKNVNVDDVTLAIGLMTGFGDNVKLQLLCGYAHSLLSTLLMRDNLIRSNELRLSEQEANTAVTKLSYLETEEAVDYGINLYEKDIVPDKLEWIIYRKAVIELLNYYVFRKMDYSKSYELAGKILRAHEKSMNGNADSAGKILVDSLKEHLSHYKKSLTGGLNYAR